MQHGVDLPQILQRFVGAFEEFDSLLVTEQAVDEAFQLVDTDLAQTPQALWLRPSGYARQPKRRVKWQGGAITTTVKVNNLFNQTVQQHIFGDLLRRTVLGEIKFRL